MLEQIKTVNKTGDITSYRLKSGELHRDDGPAVINTNGYKTWYQYGKRHREDGPALINEDGFYMWYKHGERHREDGPAVMLKSVKLYYLNGKKLIPDSTAWRLVKEKERRRECQE